MKPPQQNETVSTFLKETIHTIVDDPEVAQLLSPKHVYACKRLCIDSGYFETFNRSNVTLVDCSTAGIDITQQRIDVDGTEYALDCIVFATGFDAMTGALNSIDIQRKNSQTLKDKWAEGPRSYLGLASAGFSNFFTMTRKV